MIYDYDFQRQIDLLLISPTWSPPSRPLFCQRWLNLLLSWPWTSLCWIAAPARCSSSSTDWEDHGCHLLFFRVSSINQHIIDDIEEDHLVSGDGSLISGSLLTEPEVNVLFHSVGKNRHHIQWLPSASSSTASSTFPPTFHYEWLPSLDLGLLRSQGQNWIWALLVLMVRESDVYSHCDIELDNDNDHIDGNITGHQGRCHIGES